MSCRCLNPTTAYICGTVCSKDGVVSPNMVFSYNDALEYWSRIMPCSQMAVSACHDHEISVSCGKCHACLIRKRKDMACRLAHEVSMHDQCCFITLTYNPESVPRINEEMTLVPSDVQLFIKRLRRHLEYQPKRKHDGRDHVDHPIRYFCVGEYGGKTHRPHYHLLIFGWKPSDLVFFKQKGNVIQYRSSQVEKLWTNGFSTVEDCNAFVARYAARYVTKKYASCYVPTLNQVPEFILQSKRSGAIGAPWFDKYGVHACLVNMCTYRVGKFICKASVPKYYYSRLRKCNLPTYIHCRDMRLDWIKSNPDLHPDATFSDLVRSCERDAYDQFTNSREETL